METPTLPTNWLAALSNANHDGTTQQIDDADVNAVINIILKQ